MTPAAATGGRLVAQSLFTNRLTEYGSLANRQPPAKPATPRVVVHFACGSRFPGVAGVRVGWPDRPARAVGSRSDKKLHHPQPNKTGTGPLARTLRWKVFAGLNPHGAASCRFATPGHPVIVLVNKWANPGKRMHPRQRGIWEVNTFPPGTKHGLYTKSLTDPDRQFRISPAFKPRLKWASFLSMNNQVGRRAALIRIEESVHPHRIPGGD